MTYKLQFVAAALKEWKKLDSVLQKQFKNKLAERLENPLVQKDKLSGWNNIFKIKLRSAGYRLIYEVNKKEITVLVLAIGKRERREAYRKAFKRK